MKRCLCLLLALAMLCLVGCADEAAPIPPPTRIGAGTAKVTPGARHTFATAAAEADAVAHITVGDWLSENTDTMSTHYRATVAETFRGSLPNEITLIQDGCSTTTIPGYPLFTGGNELLLFLKACTEPDTYWIVGSYTTVLDVAYVPDGTRYFAQRGSSTLSPRNTHTKDAALVNAIYADLRTRDPAVDHTVSALYTAAELEQLLNIP